MSTIEALVDFAFRHAGIVFPATLLLLALLVLWLIGNYVITPIARIAGHKGK